MVKVKESVKKSLATTKVKATPVCATIGKVRKLRINIKNIRKSRDFIPDNSTKRSIGQGDSKILGKSGSLEKKFQRTPANATQCRENKNITLRAQCKVIEKDKSGLNLESNQTKISISSKKRVNFVDECNLLTRRVGKKGAEKRTRNKKNDKTQILKSVSVNIYNNSLDSITTKTFPKDSHHSPEYLSIRNCCVKVQRLPFKIGVKEVQQTIKHSTPSYSKRCVVRLQKTPVTIRNNLSNQKTLIVPRCKLKLKRISNDNKENKLVGHKESRQKTKNPIQTNTSYVLPVIDNIKFIPTKISTESESLKENRLNDDNMNSPQSIHKRNNKNLKHLPKLSLKKTNQQKGNSVLSNLELTQFDAPLDSTIHFEPIRNSTLLEPGLNKNKINDDQVKRPLNSNSKENTSPRNIFLPQNLDNTAENSGENTKPKSRSASRNLANKSDEIENLLNSLDDDVNHDEKENGGQAKISPIKTRKFFHSKVGNLDEKSSLVSKSKTKSKIRTKKHVINKKRRFTTKRSLQIRQKDIYDFLSQSQTSDSEGGKHSDPAADIIKKLINQGKVRVATNCRGKGKPMFKRKIPKKQMKKNNQIAVKNGKKIKNSDVKSNNIPFKEVKNQVVDDDHFDNDFDDDVLTPDANNGIDNINENIDKRLKNNSINDQEGTFSRLARSVLMKQAGRSNMERKKNSHLLELVKQYISTPKNKQPFTETASHPDISPISMPKPRPKTMPSPWRVDEDDGLPRTFNFFRSSANLPSFSSDYLPSTPRKEKSKNNITKLQQQSSNFSDHTHQSFLPLSENQNTLGLVYDQSSHSSNLKDAEQRQKISVEKEPSSISSFSSNDSNAENMPPSNVQNKEHNNNNDIFDLRQLPNPRRTLTYRSPLKTINILEVVHLPPYKSPVRTNSKGSGNDVVNMAAFKENTFEKSLQTEEYIANKGGESPQKNSNKNRNELVEEDLFGFEEFLSQPNELSREDNGINEKHDYIADTNITIHDKLQGLRKLKPDDNELQLSSVKDKTNYPSTLFENGTNSAEGMKQKNVKEMLSSTVINPKPSTSRNALKELTAKKLWVARKPNLEENTDQSELFKDPEPETTFNENTPHRTYVQPFKRKRRLKENKFLVYLESAESGNEEMLKDHQKHNHSSETDTSPEKNPKTKRQRKLQKENQELEEFVKEFNEMCDEVNSFELRVEKSA